MSRMSYFLAIPALLAMASPALAGSDTTTEHAAAFDEHLEGTAIGLSLRGTGPQRATEQVATFESSARTPAGAAALAPGEGGEQATEHVAAFESGAEAPRAAAAGHDHSARTMEKMPKECGCAG